MYIEIKKIIIMSQLKNEENNEKKNIIVLS